jgi:hypothetical protein
MRRLPLRRSQLVGANGPGSLIVSPEGETAIVGALDYWFSKETSNEKNRAEFEIFEPRLKGFLGVNKLYMPPDFRKSHEDTLNSNIMIPLLRFPLWHYCPFCKELNHLNYSAESSRKFCKTCNQNRYMKQVPFITICKKGHISDFPWIKWVHKGQECKGTMVLNTGGGATLDSWSIKCSCGSKRSLKGITAKREGSSVITEELYGNGEKFYCEGHKAWCADEFERCGEATLAILRNSINVYLPQKISVISLPGEKNQNVDKLLDFLQRQSIVNNLVQSQIEIKEKVTMLYNAASPQLNVSKEDCEKTILYMESSIGTDDSKENSPLILREKEFEILQTEQNEAFLKVYEEWSNEQVDAATFAGIYTKFIKKINRVSKLRETTALASFKRLSSIEEDGSYKFNADYDLMYHKKVMDKKKWLPAYSVFGEGIFIQFNLEEIHKWEQKNGVQQYFIKYLKRIENMQHYMPEIINSPRNIMMHSLAHLIIEEISNVSGYNMASIKERLYLNENQAGILIYTSAGDIEGTFGGLVRLGNKDKFFSLLDKALGKSYWCSSDPICTEFGMTHGQGLHNSNGAACYNCIYIPETSCECGNMYLDRTLLSDKILGFFNFDEA